MVVSLAVAAASLACAARDTTPGPPPPPPDLGGLRVMLLPVRAPAPAQLDAELTFWIVDRSLATDWVLPGELEAAIERTPAWRVRLETLQRPIIDLGGGDRRLRDPLYGVLRQLGALVDANYAVVPGSPVEVRDSTGTDVLRLPVAVVDIELGRVLWLHTLQGEGNTDPRVAVASVAEAVARALFP